MVYLFEEIDEFNRGKIVSGPLAPFREEERDSFDDNDFDFEIRRKVIFMLNVTKQLLEDGLISDFSILRSSLEQVFKKLVREHTSLN